MVPKCACLVRKPAPQRRTLTDARRTVPRRWVRGRESAVLLEPRHYEMSILALGTSVATPPDGIVAEAIVVESFDELRRRANETRGKIVVFNQPWVSYGVSVEYRRRGASEAARAGAVASLIRSVTPFSINSPHTGSQTYESGVMRIPTACITVEDAETLARMQRRGQRIVIRLLLEARNEPDVPSRNVVAEIVGSVYPEQVCGPASAARPRAAMRLTHRVLCCGADCADQRPLRQLGRGRWRNGRRRRRVHLLASHDGAETGASRAGTRDAGGR